MCKPVSAQRVLSAGEIKELRQSGIGIGYVADQTSARASGAFRPDLEFQ